LLAITLSDLHIVLDDDGDAAMQHRILHAHGEPITCMKTSTHTGDRVWALRSNTRLPHHLLYRSPCYNSARGAGQC
jgi:hypothetical protein